MGRLVLQDCYCLGCDESFTLAVNLPNATLLYPAVSSMKGSILPGAFLVLNLVSRKQHFLKFAYYHQEKLQTGIIVHWAMLCQRKRREKEIKATTMAMFSSPALVLPLNLNTCNSVYLNSVYEDPGGQIGMHVILSSPEEIGK